MFPVPTPPPADPACVPPPANAAALADLLEPGMRTLELGPGVYADVFAGHGCAHTPGRPAGASLTGAFDLVLIDGARPYPQPVADWLDAAPLLAPGGMLVVVDDDPAVGLGRLLDRDDDWRPRAGRGTLSVYEKVAPAPVLAPAPEPVDEPEQDDSPLLVLAFAHELLSHPELLDAFAREIRREDGVELLVYAPNSSPEELEARLSPALEAAGLAGDGTPEIVAVAVPATAETDEQLARSVHCLYARIVPEGPFRSLRRISYARAAELCELAAKHRAGALPGRPGEDELAELRRSNFLLLTFDSCRYDVLRDAATPVLDSFAEIVPAQTPASFTYAAHQAFFVGMLPNAVEPRPYYNRFTRQLLGLGEVGETDLAKDTLRSVASTGNVVSGLREAGYQTVGAGAMNWFRQEALTGCFERFAFTGTDADAQIDFLLSELDPGRPFFGFVNFGETHDPYTYRGKTTRISDWIQSRRMVWPPVQEGAVGVENEGYGHQREAAEFLDSRLPRLFSALPGNTIAIVCGDHGECFGEDGYWGHGVNHPKVQEVPLAIFRLDGAELS